MFSVNELAAEEITSLVPQSHIPQVGCFQCRCHEFTELCTNKLEQNSSVKSLKGRCSIKGGQGHCWKGLCFQVQSVAHSCPTVLASCRVAQGLRLLVVTA